MLTLAIVEIGPREAAPLLEAGHLPLIGLAATTMWAARHGDTIVGVAGIESFGDVVLLRSVTTEAASRGRGVARTLCEAVLAEAKARGARTVFLLTETAEGFFAQLGFETLPREMADPRLLPSSEFQEARCASAKLMRKSL